MLRLHRLAMQRYDQAHSSTAAASHLSALRRSSMRALIAGGSFFQVLPTWRVQKMGVGVGDLRKGALLSAVSSCCSFSGTRKPAEHQTAMCQPGRLLATPLWPQPSPLAPGPSPQAPAPPPAHDGHGREVGAVGLLQVRHRHGGERLGVGEGFAIQGLG